jgi:selenocysteine-specific elongation factor
LILAGRFDPPWVRDLAAAAGAGEAPVREALRRLTRQGALYQVVRDLFYHPVSIGELAAIAGSIADSTTPNSIAGAITHPVSAAAFRDASGLGRKRAIQVLEFFDRLGYTRFHREAHWLRGPRGTHPLEQPDPEHPVR